MLTGDKGLTAKQIGKSCGLIPADSMIEHVDRKDSMIAPYMQKSILRPSRLVEIEDLTSKRQLK